MKRAEPAPGIPKKTHEKAGRFRETILPAPMVSPVPDPMPGIARAPLVGDALYFLTLRYY